MVPEKLKEFKFFRNAASASLEAIKVSPAGSHPLYKAAVVAGATGATGRYIVGHLLTNGVAGKTIALTRRHLQGSADVARELHLDANEVEAHLAAGRLEVKQIDFDLLVKEKKPQWDADVAFCALGSAPYSEYADFVVPTAFAEAALAGGAEYMALVSSQGAKPTSWVGYLQTMGRREESFKAITFPLGLSIWRAGMLDRGEKAAERLKERFLHWTLPNSQFTDTRDLALAMVADAALAKQKSQGNAGGFSVYESGDIKQIIKAMHEG